MDALYRDGELVVDRVIDVHMASFGRRLATLLLNPLLSTLFEG